MTQETLPLKTGLAEMLKGGVIMDVTTPEQARIAEDAGAVAVMALERVPADIRKEGGIARMADPDVVLRIGREVAVSCPFTHLGRRMIVTLQDSFTETPFMTLRIKAYVYDHRHEPAMQTDILRRTKREFLNQGILKAWEHGGGTHERS
jgi:hypothetical protein